MKTQELTRELLADLKQRGYRSLIAKGAPQGENGSFTQALLASKQEVHKEETAEATWQVSVDDDSFLENANMKYVVEAEE